MKNILKYITYITIPFLVSCESDEKRMDITDGKISPVEFDLILTRDDNGVPKEDPDDYFKVDESCVLISQQFTSSSTSIDFSEGSRNCYKYVYNGNKDATWDSGFNFTSVDPLSWETIYMNGQFNNGFAFAALFFPRDYKYTTQIVADQRERDAFYECDVLGGWHKTSQFRERLRFRMFHLMCLLRVNLYVPVFDEESANGIDPDAVVASAINFRTSYAVSFPDRTSDDFPPKLDATDDVIQDIFMYELAEPVVIENMPIDVYNNIGEDTVRKYSFEMIFPYQTVSGDILRFTLQRGEMSYNYVYNPNRNPGSSSPSFEQGTINQLELYLPRTDNELVLMRAYLKDWNEAKTNDFTITEEDPQEENL